MKHSRSKNAVLLMIIFICSICLNNVWARETGNDGSTGKRESG